jgi:hypothetical protein
MRRGLLLALLVLLGPACPSHRTSSIPGNPYEKPSVYFSTMTSMVVEVAYESGAEPATGPGLTGRPLWEFLQDNLGSLFQRRSVVPQITVPTDLSQMKSVPAQSKTSWTLDDVVALAASQRTGTCTASTGDFFVVFLNGYFEGASGPDPSILAAYVIGTTVIAVSKPAVSADSSGDLPVFGAYMEQFALVHEMGHALGLVNHGLPMVADHEDTAHPAHCSNPSCIMYWQNEGAGAVRQFVQSFMATGDENVYGTECLRDAALYAP